VNLNLKSSNNQLRNFSLRITFFRNASFVLSGLVLLVGSCSPAPEASPTMVAKVEATSTSLPATPVPPAATITPSATHTPWPAHEVQICSPLAIQPLAKIKSIITQPFIMPRVMDDGTYKDSGHHGVDVGFMTRGKQKFTGTPVLAAVPGKIASLVDNLPPYGDMVMVETPLANIPKKIIDKYKIPPGNSVYTLYAHLQNVQSLKTGQPIHCGQQLAETGLTGLTDGPHLHFETRWGPSNTVFPPMGYYLSGVTPEEMESYTLWRMSGKYKLFDPFELLYP